MRPILQKFMPMWLIVLGFSTTAVAENHKRDDLIQINSEYSYHSGRGDSQEKAKSLALFGAKIKAVKLAAKYLTHKGLLKHYEERANEVYCLVTDEISATILDEDFNRDEESFYVKIKSEITSVDFIKAEIRDLELSNQESHFTYKKEMEQQIGQDIDPGKDLSRAYRYIRNRQWRIAVIYLNHLEKKYPYWSDTYFAKAIAYYGMNDKERMALALKAACSFKKEEACEELRSLHIHFPNQN